MSGVLGEGFSLEARRIAERDGDMRMNAVEVVELLDRIKELEQKPEFKLEDHAMLCGHGYIICVRCDFIPSSWRQP